MGAWGIKTFENDDASDWVYDLEKTSDLSLLRQTLELADCDYLEAPDGCNILAACEVILALMGKAGSGLPDEVTSWLSKNASLDATPLAGPAKASLARVLSQDSELKELWEETDDFQTWESGVLNIKSRLET